jgi:hypothetical protein
MPEMTHGCLWIAAAGAALAVATLLPPGASAAGPGSPELRSDVTLVEPVRDRRHYDRDHGTHIWAPFTDVDTREGTYVRAPFARVYSDRRGSYIRAPFVDLFVPR